MRCLILFLVTLPIWAGAAIDPAHFVCEEDSDCVLVSNGGCCGPSFAARKGHERMYEKPKDEECKRMNVACPLFVKAVCEGRACRAATEKEVCGTLKGEQRRCAKDSECRAYNVTCRDWYFANKSAASEVDAYSSCLAAHTKCDIARKAPPKGIFCREGYCTR